MRLRSEASERSAILYYVSDTKISSYSILVAFISDLQHEKKITEANKTRSASHPAETLQRLS